MDSKKNYAGTIRKISAIIVDIIIVFCLFKMVTGITTGTEQIYETQRSMFLWQGVMYFSFALLLCAKVNYKNGWLWVIYIAYTVIEYYFLIKTGYRENSPTIWAWYTRLWNAVGIVGIIFANSLFEKRIHKFEDVNKVVMILLWVSCIGMMAVKSFGLNDTALLCLILAISLIKFDDKQIRKFMLLFFSAYYVAFARMFVNSLLNVPYMGEERYYGTFTNNGLFGAFAGGATICCILIAYLAYMRGGMVRKIGVAVSAVLCIPTLYAVSIISARVAMLGVFVTVVVFMIMMAIKGGHRRLIKGIICGTVVFFAAFFTLLFLLYNFMPRDTLEIVKDNHKYIGATLLFWYDRVVRFYYTKSLTGLIPEGSFWNGIDLFTGGRISYWLEYAKRLNLFGHPYLTEWVDFNGDVLTLSHPHNTFLSFLYLYGIVFGGLFVITIVYSYINNIKVMLKNNSNNRQVIFLISFIWITYCFGIYLNEDFMLNFLPTFMLLIMQSMLLVGKNKNAVTDKVESIA